MNLTWLCCDKNVLFTFLHLNTRLSVTYYLVGCFYLDFSAGLTVFGHCFILFQGSRWPDETLKTYKMSIQAKVSLFLWKIALESPNMILLL